MDTLDALYKSICESPLEDTPRLMYADALDERGLPGDALRARYIRLQVEIAPLGVEPRLLFETLVKRHGPGYFSVTVAPGGADVAVGDRVDVRPHNGRRLLSVMHGLRVTRVLPDDPTLGLLELVLREDAGSVPWPRKEVDAKVAVLRDVLAEMHDAADMRNPASYPLQYEANVQLGAHAGFFEAVALGTFVATGRFGLFVYPAGTMGTPGARRPQLFSLEYDRGFASLFRGSKLMWEQHKGWLTERFPITLVRHTTR